MKKVIFCEDSFRNLLNHTANIYCRITVLQMFFKIKFTKKVCSSITTDFSSKFCCKKHL